MRLFSIDGGHTAAITEKDLQTAAECLVDGGAVILDDVFNEAFPAVSEGLLSYLPRDAVLRLWSAFAKTTSRFGQGIYLADLHVDTDAPPLLARAFAGMLSAFVRSPVGVHFASEAEARDALRTAGFGSISVGLASEHREGQGLNGAERVRIVRATIG